MVDTVTWRRRRATFYRRRRAVETDVRGEPLVREPDVEMPADAGLAEATRRFQVDYIRRSIRLASSNMTEAARILGLHRSNLYRKMGQLEMTESEQEPPEE